MEERVSIEEILRQFNLTLAPEDRITEDEIAAAGARLKAMLAEAQCNTNTAGPQGPPPSSARVRQRLAAFWSAIKDKLTVWLAPLTPKWQKLIGMLRDRLQDLENKKGQELLLALALVVVAVATVAALIKSLPLLIALLAILGGVTLLRFLEVLTRFPLIVR